MHNKKRALHPDLTEPDQADFVQFPLSSGAQSSDKNVLEEPVIYVIDDDECVRQSMRWLLYSTGYQIKIFNCVVDFLAVYKDGPGCLILDINLAGTDGLEFAKRLPALKIDLPVIVTTGNPGGREAEQAKRAGAIGFLEKPCNGFVLLALVCGAIEQNALERTKEC